MDSSELEEKGGLRATNRHNTSAIGRTRDLSLYIDKKKFKKTFKLLVVTNHEENGSYRLKSWCSIRAPIATTKPSSHEMTTEAGHGDPAIIASYTKYRNYANHLTGRAMAIGCARKMDILKSALIWNIIC